MTLNDELDMVIKGWLDETAAGPAAADARAILEMVDRTRQRRRFVSLRAPFLGVPTAPPVVRARVAVVVAVGLLALLAVAGLTIGSRPHVPSPFAPQSIVDVPNTTGAIILGPAEGGVWIGGDHVAIRVDSATAARREVAIPVAAGRWTGLFEHDGVLWAADWLGNRIVRVETATGRLLPEITTRAPNMPAWAGGGVWVASGNGALSRIDPEAGVTDLRIEPGPRAFIVIGDGLWFVDRFTSRSLVRVDAATGTTTDRIDLPIELGGLGGLLEGPGGVVWAWDSGSGGASHVVTADPASRQVSSFTVPSNLIGGIARIDGRVWAVEGPEDGHPGQLQELTSAGPTGHVLALPPDFDPDWGLIAGDSFWLPTEATGQVFRFPLDALQ